MKNMFWIFVLTFSILTSTNLSIAQWNWKWCNPIPTGNGINDIYSFSATEFLAVGSSGLIMRTTNGGTSWTMISSGTSKYLSKIYFADANTGWICGENGIVLRTTDHGVHWQTIETGAGSLSSICFSGTSTGWACGDNGMIIKTTDGGLNWDSKNSGTTEYLGDICFTSATVGYIVGSQGVILKTINGGNIWARQTSTTTKQLMCIRAVGTSIFAFGLNGTVLKSNDAGSTWLTSNNGISTDIYYADVADANNIWAVGPSNVVYKTSDGGATWIGKNPWIGGNIDNGPTITGDFYSACFPSSTTGIVCGSGGVIYQTSNDGTNWTSRSNSFTNKDAKGITFSDSQHGFLLVNPNDNTSNALYRTTDGGTSWAAVANSNPVTFIKMFSDGTGIRYAGDTRGFETTTDHGANWAANGGARPSSVVFPIFEFASKLVGFTGGNGGFTNKTINGGISWTPITAPYVDIIGGCSMPDINTIWIVEWSDGVNVLLSTNGGTTWSQPAGTISDNRSSIFAFDASRAWAGSTNGKLYKTINGGASFTEVDPLLGGLAVTDIKFLSSDTGFVVAASGGFSSTVDGGTTWTPGSIGSSDWKKIGVASHKSIFFVGNKGMLVQGINGPAVSVKDFTNETPKTFSLSQNYPNPFNPATTISLSLPSKSFVSLKVFDLLGREVATIIAEQLSAGNYTKQWNANGMPSGVYFYRLQTGTFTETKKLIFLK